ncbi:MAG TPA: hypothetical protein VK200_10835, partial [Candidatus Limnocylindrales bacterium]|nr:hypothetical protein [Candidatus Limnocylindrales bacterium]
MAIWLSIILVTAALAEAGWSQTARPNTATDLAKYLGGDRERLLYDGASKEGKLVWYTSLS